MDGRPGSVRFAWCAGPDAWPRLRDAGFDGVEVGAASTFGDDAPGLPDGVPVETTNLFLPGGARLVGPDARDWGPYVGRMIRRAAEAGVRLMVVGSGGARRAAAGQDPAEAEAVFADLVAAWQTDAHAAGVVLAPEPLNRRECDVMVRYPAMARMLAERGCRSTLDSYHALVERPEGADDPDAFWAAEIPVEPVHLHLSGADRLPPRADDPWLAALARRMRAAGYAGRVSVEAPMPGDAAALRAVADLVRVAYA